MFTHGILLKGSCRPVGRSGHAPRTLTAVARTATYVVEIAVGLACFAAAAGARARSRALAAILVLAGLAATIHGAVALVV